MGDFKTQQLDDYTLEAPTPSIQQVVILRCCHSRDSGGISKGLGSIIGKQCFMQRPVHPSYGRVKHNLDGCLFVSGRVWTGKK